MKYTALKNPNPMTPQEIYIPVDSQELADELKEICIKYGLPIWEHECAFLISEQYVSFFAYGTHLEPNSFGVWVCDDYSQILNKLKINKEQFIELLDNINN